METSITQREQALEVEESKVVPLNWEKAFMSFSDEEQNRMRELAKEINLMDMEKIMNYGHIPLRETFEQCGRFLKDKRGTTADQTVMNQVVVLSKKANQINNDFNFVLKEPNFFQKLFMKIVYRGKTSRRRMEKIRECATTNYKLLMELQKSCDIWLNLLREEMENIDTSVESDYETGRNLEQYIIAGKIAQSTMEQELQEVRRNYQETGLQEYKLSYETLKEGYDTFLLNMSNLEKSRIMYQLSITQLGLIRRSNRNVQTVVQTQMDNSMTLMGQQIRNAVLNAEIKEVVEGQKAIKGLNDELMKEISQTVGLTAKETEKMLYTGFYDVKAAKTAVQYVIQSCTEIQRVAEEMFPKIKTETEELNRLMEELQPTIQTLKVESTSSNKGGKLVF